MTDLPKRVQINEEGPREGFQIEKTAIPTQRKIQLIDALSQTGLKQIQVVSYVNPQRVPGMADADEVVAGFTRQPGVRYTALWLNKTGFLRAVAAGKLDVSGTLSLTASERFLARNQGRTLAENIAAQHEMATLYKMNKVPVRRASVMSAFGCNYQGDVGVADVLDQVRQLLEIAQQHEFRIEVLSLADTMGWATPLAVKRLVGAVRERHPELAVALHLHDTRGMGIANAYAGLEMGVSIFDAAVAGLGGCPFAANKGAAGNVCTEDLVFMLHEMGIETGVDLDRLIEVAFLAEDIVGRPLPGSVKAGGALDVLRKRVKEARQ
ncbi:hydroxymethylglutaryl-CoA lyase [Diaphorobacter sp. HDW4A]|uniref:hydroxymethylglutaryl-CoA lyase n=1 Tax=Diaphorobacter sp. HDW4A TaxID=2714924 RepID=UPI00140C5CA0|nr:hydroxymethylglutaryl-CoA lyase [Diaphorobacter sp. HDW4A]QIL80015.1 hydroxymethylglutaryl-CoA lyase [Diaphorobacter sp. HDW4A]